MGIIEDAKRKYDILVGERKGAFERRRTEILTKHPEINALLKERRALWLRAMAERSDPDQVGTESDRIEELIARALRTAGEREDALEYAPECAKCSDTGYIDGKMCSCLAQLVLDEGFNLEYTADIIRRENFDTFNELLFSSSEDNRGRSPRKTALKARDACLSFVNNMDKRYANLLIRGRAGTGKTFLTHCIAKAAMDLGNTVLYVTGYGMIDMLTKAAVGDADDSFYDYLISCDLLVIDDLGTERRTDFSEKMLYQVINERMNAQRPIVFSTNLTARELGECYDERITSRLFGTAVGVSMPDDDLRAVLKTGTNND